MLKYGADYVFSELILVNKFTKAVKDSKLEIISEDIFKTIFQIGVSNAEEVKLGVKYLKEQIPFIKEININMGCPQSTMQKNKLCGGLLYDVNLIGNVCKKLNELSKKENFIPSVKLRLGLNENDIKIKEYLTVIKENGIKKVYIHARPLKYGYNRPCLYDSVIDLKNEFNELELIFGGDIDSYNSSKDLVCDGLMIGRAALHNPFIFEDIKNKVIYREGNYDPLVKDPNVIRTDIVSLKNKKINFIREFLDLAEKYSLNVILTCNNVENLMKGISNQGLLISKMRETENIGQIRGLFENWLKN